MIEINKEEKNIIKEHFPTIHIVRTMKHKAKRHRYYCEESKPVLKLINEMRTNGIMKGRKGGVRNGYQTTAR